MRVLILGGDGYLGWPTALRFSARGHELGQVLRDSDEDWEFMVNVDSNVDLHEYPLDELLAPLLRDQIQDQRDHGLLPAWVEPDAMAALLLSLADGIALHSALNPEAIDHDAIAVQAGQLLLAARPG